MDNIDLEKITEEIRQIVAEVVEVDPKEVTPDARFVEDLGMDSTMAIEILAAVEEKYRIAIPDNAIKKIATLNQAVALAKEYIAKEEAKKKGTKDVKL
jgi:acyl carrier protein